MKNKKKKDTLDLIEKKPMGIISILDEQVRFPKASDETILDKLHSTHEKNQKYIKPRTDKNLFGVQHYAGPILYDVRGFLDKSRHNLSQDVIELFKSSSNSLIASLLKEDDSDSFIGSDLNLKKQQPTASSNNNNNNIIIIIYI